MNTFSSQSRLLKPQIYKYTIPSYIMNYFSKSKKEQFKAVKIKTLRKHLKTTKQIGKTTIPIDQKLKALLPGKRISKTGNVYYETRLNRTDASGSKI